MADFEAELENLRQKCKQANANKKKLLKAIEKNVDKLFDIICEPDPPGCAGPNPSMTLEELAEACRAANSKKKKLVNAIRQDLQASLAIVCEPNPPGCGTGD